MHITILFAHFPKNWKEPKCRRKAPKDGQKNPGQRISLHFPFLWIYGMPLSPGCLDGGNNTLFAHKQTTELRRPAPLFIIHNLLWCQGQSDHIVMVKGKIRRARSFHWLKIQEPKPKKKGEKSFKKICRSWKNWHNAAKEWNKTTSHLVIINRAELSVIPIAKKLH